MTEPMTAWFARYQEGFLLAKRAAGLSENTVLDYKRQFGHFAGWLQDRGVPTTSQLKAYLAWLRQRPNDNLPGETLSPKTVVNGYIAIRSFFRWLCRGHRDPQTDYRHSHPEGPDRRHRPSRRGLDQGDCQGVRVFQARPADEHGCRYFDRPDGPPATPADVGSVAHRSLVTLASRGWPMDAFDVLPEVVDQALTREGLRFVVTSDEYYRER